MSNDDILNAKLSEMREIEVERLKKQLEPIAMMMAASTSAFQQYGFSRIEAIGLSIEFLKTGAAVGKKVDK